MSWKPWDERSGEECGVKKDAFFYSAWQNHPGPVHSITGE